MDLYLSEFEIGNLPRHPAYDRAIEVVLSFCVPHDLHCWRSKDHAEYPEIERRIRSSGIFVAVIDGYWTSSTWKAHELTYACGGPSMNDGPRRTQDMKVIAFLTDDAEYPIWLHGSPHPVTVAQTLSDLAGALAEMNHVPLLSAGHDTPNAQPSAPGD